MQTSGVEIDALPLAASWASIFMVLFLLVLIAAVWKLTLVVLRLIRRSEDWTVPKQDSKIVELRRDVTALSVRSEAHQRDIDSAHAKVDAVAREQQHYRREQINEQEALLKEIRSIGSQIAALLTVRDEVADMRAVSTKLEQDITSLVCFEDAQLRKQSLPGFCPLRKVACPLNGEINGVNPEEPDKDPV